MWKIVVEGYLDLSLCKIRDCDGIILDAFLRQREKDPHGTGALGGSDDV